MAKLLIEALDMLEAGQWEAAHEVVDGDESAEASWLHAHLHRVEGDEENARYWYERAGLEPFQGDEYEERYALRTALTQDPL